MVELMRHQYMRKQRKCMSVGPLVVPFWDRCQYFGRDVYTWKDSPFHALQDARKSIVGTQETKARWLKNSQKTELDFSEVSCSYRSLPYELGPGGMFDTPFCRASFSLSNGIAQCQNRSTFTVETLATRKSLFFTCQE